MSVRPFDWRDLTTLHRFRHNSVFLNSLLALTRGPMLVPGALLSYLAPGMGILTYVCSGDGNEQPLIGQAIQFHGEPFAYLTFLAPLNALDGPLVYPLLDALAMLTGEQGALHLLADVNERTEAFNALRQAGYAIYGRQRIWQVPGLVASEPHNTAWRPAGPQDVLAIRLLYNNLVPGLVQQVEPYLNNRPRGLVHRQQGELLAYVDLKYGHRGIWAQPFVHPDATDIVDCFIDLIQNLPRRQGRPLYICVRSYQSWLEPAIEELGAEPGPRQAVMVKHLAAPQRVGRAFALPALESGQPETTVPIARAKISTGRLSAKP